MVEYVYLAEVVKRYTCLPAGRHAALRRCMYYVYILKSLKTGEFYKGLTDNIDRRLEEHDKGKSPATRTRLPFKLIHVEPHESRQKAREVEEFFKSGYGREIIKELAEIVE